MHRPRRRRLILCLVALLSSSTATVTPQVLLPIQQGELHGFVDTAGQVAITPQFGAVGWFADGLAPARSEGLYGYIDTAGTWVISPAWDRAFPFGTQGSARVYRDTLDQLIDRTGRIIEERSPRHSLVRSISENFELHRADTFYTVQQSGSDKPLLSRVTSVGMARNGRFGVSYRDRGNQLRHSYLDSFGTILFSFGDSVGSPDYGAYAGSSPLGHFEHGYATILFPDERLGLIDTTGRVILTSHDYLRFVPLSRRAVLAEKRGYSWVVLDEEGKERGEEYHGMLIWNYEGSAVAYIESGESIVALDETGLELARLVVPSGAFTSILDGRLYIRNRPGERFSYWNPWSGRYDAERFDSVIFHRAIAGMRMVVEDRRIGWIDSAGEYIWRASQPIDPHAIDIDVPREAQWRVEVTEVYGERADDVLELCMMSTMPVAPLRASTEEGRPGTFSVEIVRRGDSSFAQVVNRTFAPLYFSSECHLLPLRVEAFDTVAGAWFPIEYLPDAASREFPLLFSLGPDRFWEFPLPRFRGDITTVLRFALRCGPSPDRATMMWARSEEFEGGVNRGQFLRQ